MPKYTYIFPAQLCRTGNSLAKFIDLKIVFQLIFFAKTGRLQPPPPTAPPSRKKAHSRQMNFQDEKEKEKEKGKNLIRKKIRSRRRRDFLVRPKKCLEKRERDWLITPIPIENLATAAMLLEKGRGGGEEAKKIWSGNVRLSYWIMMSAAALEYISSEIRGQFHQRVYAQLLRLQIPTVQKAA